MSVHPVKDRLKVYEEEKILNDKKCEKEFSRIVATLIYDDKTFFSLYHRRNSIINWGNNFKLNCPAMKEIAKLDTGEKMEFDLIPPSKGFFRDQTEYVINVNVKN